MTTTHSPYILGQINNMLMADRLSRCGKISEVIEEICIIKSIDLSAFYISSGELRDAMDEGLIDNALIDGASRDINDQADKIIELI